jgi:hypothetical protein
MAVNIDSYPLSSKSLPHDYYEHAKPLLPIHTNMSRTMIVVVEVAE